MSLLVVATPGSRAEVGIAVGDYWEYGIDGSYEDITISGTIMYKVASTTQDTFILEIDGSGDLSGISEGVSVSGDVEFGGSMERLRSNFSLLQSTIAMELSIVSSGFTVTTTIGLIESDDPSLDDYIGDDNPSEGVTVVSRCEAQLDTWINVMGFFNTSESMTENVTVTMEVLEENVTVSVPAGTFECYDVSFEFDTGSDVSTEHMYYSSEVGYYVKMEEADFVTMGLSSLELTDYSYGESGSGGIMSMLADNWLILAIIVVAIIVVIVLAVVLRPKPPLPSPVPPPVQPMPPPAQ